MLLFFSFIGVLFLVINIIVIFRIVINYGKLNTSFNKKIFKIEKNLSSFLKEID